jgi:plastocyanin
MPHVLRKAVPLALVAVLAIPASALAATTNITMTNFVFTPSSTKIALGGTAHWENQTTSTSHTSTSDTTNPDNSAGAHWWTSGTVVAGGTFDWVFTAAGTFTYHCIFHQGLGMIGTVTVADKISPTSGVVGTKFAIKIATVTAPAGFTYDVQIKAPGAPSFVNFKTGVTATKVTFNSTGMATGTYQFRSRLTTTIAPPGSSEWSPAKSLMVT